MEEYIVPAGIVLMGAVLTALGIFLNSRMFVVSGYAPPKKAEPDRVVRKDVLTFDSQEKARYYDEIEKANLPSEIKSNLEDLVAMGFSAGFDHYLRKVLTHPNTGEYSPELIVRLNMDEIEMLKTIASTGLEVNQKANWWTLSRRG